MFEVQDGEETNENNNTVTMDRVTDDKNKYDKKKIKIVTK